jgi:Fe-S oxidoreductase
METPKGERFSDLRLDQAVGTGAEILITSCPYCITNFEDSRMNRPDGDSFAVREITELLQEAT